MRVNQNVCNGIFYITSKQKLGFWLVGQIYLSYTEASTVDWNGVCANVGSNPTFSTRLPKTTVCRNKVNDATLTRVRLALLAFAVGIYRHARDNIADDYVKGV
jgi:hypothetical protein